jgi:hypothetical protein
MAVVVAEQAALAADAFAHACVKSSSHNPRVSDVERECGVAALMLRLIAAFERAGAWIGVHELRTKLRPVLARVREKAVAAGVLVLDPTFRAYEAFVDAAERVGVAVEPTLLPDGDAEPLLLLALVFYAACFAALVDRAGRATLRHALTLLIMTAFTVAAPVVITAPWDLPPFTTARWFVASAPPAMAACVVLVASLRFWPRLMTALDRRMAVVCVVLALAAHAVAVASIALAGWTLLVSSLAVQVAVLAWAR